VTNHVFLVPQVALQFPDELLCDSVPIYHSLKRAVDSNTELYVLADTSYGRCGPHLFTHQYRLTGNSCCVDEVAAQHVDADAVVHYGHACMSKSVISIHPPLSFQSVLSTP
jgi:diphthamide biosynthesis protein 2